MKTIVAVLLFWPSLGWSTPYTGYPFADFHWKAPVVNAAALPASGNLLGDSRTAMDTFDIWAWDGAAWQEMTGSPTGVDNVTASLPLSSSGGNAPNLTCRVATASVSGCLAAADFTTFNGKQAAGDYITALTGDVTAAGPGSVAATVVLVGGSSAANVHSAELAANAATNANTVSTIVKRDGSGAFSAGAVSETSALIGGASSASGSVLIFKNGHLKSTQTTAPTAAPNSSAGTGATCTVANATDSAGQITLVTGTVGLSTGAYCTVTFNGNYGVAPICVFTPASSTLSTSVYATSSVSTAVVNFAIAGGISSTYLINYFCLETQ